MPEPQPRCGDSNPEDHAGSVVDDGFEPLHEQDARNPLHPVLVGESGPEWEFPAGTIVRPSRG